MGRHRKPCVIRGREFGSQSEAARHYGVTPAAVTLLKKAGRLDSLGLGTGVRRMSPERQEARAERIDREKAR
jgi:hypothetical protein